MILCQSQEGGKVRADRVFRWVLIPDQSPIRYMMDSENQKYATAFAIYVRSGNI